MIDDPEYVVSSSGVGGPDHGPADEEEGAGVWAWTLGFVRRRPVLTVFLVALAVRVLLAIGVMIFTGGELFPDSTGYNRLAADVAAGRATNWPEGTEDFYNRHATLLLPLTIVYWLIGPRVVGGLLLVAVFGSLVAAGVARLTLEILDARWAVAAGLGVALLPSQVVWSAALLKDPASWALLVGLAVAVAKGGKAQGWRLVRVALGAVALLILMVHLRIQTFIVAAWALAIATWFGEATARLSRCLGAVTIALLLPWAFGAGIAGATFVKNGAEHTEFIRTAMAAGAATAFVSQKPEPVPVDAGLQAELAELEEEVEVARREGDDARAAKLETEITRVRRELEPVEEPPIASEEGLKLRSDLAHLPKGFSVMLLEPYPWVTYDNPNVQLVRLEMLIWYPLLLLAAVGMSRAWRYRRVLAFPVIVGTGIATMYALTEGNFGTAYRHRGEFVWAIVALAAVGARVLYERFRSRALR